MKRQLLHTPDHMIQSADSSVAMLQWYYVLVGLLMAPFMGVANAYGSGLTDQDNSSMYGKLW